MHQGWVRPDQLWSSMGLPPIDSSAQTEKIKQELVPNATSDFAVAVWDHLQKLTPQASGQKGSASAEQGTEQGTEPTEPDGAPSAASAPPTTNGPAAAAVEPVPAQRVAELLKQMRDLDLELGKNYHLSQELGMHLRNCYAELRDLLGY